MGEVACSKKLKTSEVNVVDAKFQSLVVPNGKTINYVLEYFETAIATPGTAVIVEKTYAELKALRDADLLAPSAMYKITDYRTIYDQPDYSAVDVPKLSITTKTASIEPLVVIATGTGTISNFAFSTLHPTDIIHYELDYTLPVNTATATKGRITYRKDTKQNNECNWDFRTILFKRYQDADGDYMVTYDNGNSSSEFLTFSDFYRYATNNSFICDSSTDLRYNDGFYDILFDLPNIVLHDGAQDCNIAATIRDTTIGGEAINLQIRYRCVNFLLKCSTITDCYFENIVNTSLTIVGSIHGTKVYFAFQNNTLNVTDFSNNTFSFFANNTITSAQLYDNVIDRFEHCTIGGGAVFSKNVINTFRYCTCSGNFSENRFGYVTNTSFGRTNKNNIQYINTCTFGHGMDGNILSKIDQTTIGTNFGETDTNDSAPNVGGVIFGCTIGNNMHANSIDYPLDSLTIGDNFKKNRISTQLSSIDLTSATHVYQSYNCEVISNTNEDIILRYTDEYNSIVNANITD